MKEASQVGSQPKIVEVYINVDNVKKEFEEEIYNVEDDIPMKYNTKESIKKPEIGDCNSQPSSASSTSQTTPIKLEDIKQEPEQTSIIKNELYEDVFTEIDNFHCNTCFKTSNKSQNKCSNVSHLLNRRISQSDPGWQRKTIPINLEIRSTLIEEGVFALKTLSKDVIFGPFQGISSVKFRNRHMWRIHDKKLINLDSGNWMMYVNCAEDPVYQNLDVFQFRGSLYFQTKREINEDEQLLIYYDEKDVQTDDVSDETYFIPLRGEKSQKVFACMYCCVGFKVKKCLIEHKKKCPLKLQSGTVKEIVQCENCKIWLDKMEHSEHHMVYCCEDYSRVCDYPAPVDESKISNQPKLLLKKPTSEIKTATTKKVKSKENSRTPRKTLPDNIELEKRFKCKICPYETNRKADFRAHLDIHMGIKRHECDICLKKFCNKSNLNQHVISKHLRSSDKTFKCLLCTYATNCEQYLTRHIGNRHTNDIVKNFKCTLCPFETHRKDTLQYHINSHGDFKPFQCHICAARFRDGFCLKRHISRKHREGPNKDYRCQHCKYETNCKFSLKLHVKNKHMPDVPKTFQCLECSYSSNFKNNYIKHIIKHSDVTDLMLESSEQIGKMPTME